MSEATFAGQSRTVLEVLKSRREGEFIEIGIDLFESDDLLDSVYQVFVGLLTEGWRSGPLSDLHIDDIGNAYLKGFYLPCCQRTVLAGQIDRVNDRIEEYAGIVLFNECRNRPLFVTSRKVEIFPRHVQCPPFAVSKHICTWFFEDAQTDRKDRRIFSKQMMQCVQFYFAIMESGVLVPCLDSRKYYTRSFAAAIHTAAAALNGESDRSHLWNIRTSEELTGAGLNKTPLVLGVSAEHVKSLFYARSLPVTETGRKRPILHWVAAHARRLKSGTEIDIDRHLRGCESFEMEGFSFEIFNPRKEKK